MFKFALAVQRKLALFARAAMLEDLLIPARNRLEVGEVEPDAVLAPTDIAMLK